MAESPVPEVWSFPTNPDDFGEDDRISFSRLDNKYVAVQEDGTEYEFDADLKRWIPLIDEALIEQQRSGYGGLDSREEAAVDGRNQGKKRKKDEREDNVDDASTRKAKRQTNKPAAQPKQNTAIYVTGLPLDATVDEVHELFSRKCGVVAEEIDSGRPRIKMYKDAEGRFQGDALVVFFKPQSVDMAVVLLDDTDFRLTQSGLTTGKMRVQPADLSYKKSSYDAPAGGQNATADGSAPKKNGQGPSARASGTSNGSGRSAADKQKIIRKTQKLDAKLADWDDDDPSAMPLELQPVNKPGKVVILRHMFTLEELEADPVAILDIKEDIRDECAKLGVVTNVVLYDLEEDGVVSVKFRTPEAAQACVDLMDGRAFDGRTVQAIYATGKEKFKKSKKGEPEHDPSDDDDE